MFRIYYMKSAVYNNNISRDVVYIYRQRERERAIVGVG